MKVTSLKKDAILPAMQTALAAINGKYGYGVHFFYTCSECGLLAGHRRESEAPKQTLGKFHCAVHPKARVKREPAKRGMA